MQVFLKLEINFLCAFVIHYNNYYDLHETEVRRQIKCENQGKKFGNTIYNRVCKFLQNMHSEHSIKRFSWD